MTPFFSLQEKVAIITGGASGIGLATVQRFRDAGARVMLADLRSDAARIAEQQGVEFHPVDVSVESQVASLVDATVERFGQLDILINNAGIQPLGIGFEKLTPALMQRTLEVNVHGVAWGIKHGSRVMANGARIVSTASFVGTVGTPDSSIYSASKAAVIQMTRCAAVELAPRGITVNCVCPGTIRTPSVTGIADNPEIPFVTQRTPAKRLGESAEVAAAFHYLASDEAAYLTGVALPVDGGISAGWEEYPLLVPQEVRNGAWDPPPEPS